MHPKYNTEMKKYIAQSNFTKKHWEYDYAGD